MFRNYIINNYTNGYIQPSYNANGYIYIMYGYGVSVCISINVSSVLKPFVSFIMPIWYRVS